MNSLRDEAAHPGRVAEVFDGVDEAAAEIAKVEAAERVDFASVAANLAVVGVGCALLCSREDDVVGGPCIIRRTLVELNAC